MVTMLVPVGLHLMATAHGLENQILLLRDERAQEEDGGLEPQIVQGVEDRRSANRARAVVKSQCHLSGVGWAPPRAEVRRKRATQSGPGPRSKGPEREHRRHVLRRQGAGRRP